MAGTVYSAESIPWKGHIVYLALALRLFVQEEHMTSTNDGKTWQTDKTKLPVIAPAAYTSEFAVSAALAEAEATTSTAPLSETTGRKGKRRQLLLTGLAIILLIAALFYGIPWVKHILNTVSTDDAFVNGHVTFVAARVPGQVVNVLVDDNYRVRQGERLVGIDKEPYRVLVEIKRAAVATAKADLAVVQAQVRGIEAQARSQRWKLQHAIEDVDNQIALLHAKVAGLQTKKAILARAQSDFLRAQSLLPEKAISRSEYDQQQEAMLVAEAQVKEAEEEIYEVRASLGLPAKPENGEGLANVPPDLNQTFSSVRQAQADLINSAAQFGYSPSSFELTPKEMIEEFYKQKGGGKIDTIYARLAKEAPAVKQAAAKLVQVQSDLEEAELNLRYCDVFAEIDGVVTRRNVNPGNNVQAGQSLMAVRSLREIWVDANFKETQLSYLRIGQPVDLYIDMYGEQKIFKGRISGFTMGTGSTLTLLPPENATGNFVKVVQRLPVRIDLEDYDPDKQVLFAGLSVEPYVYFKEPPVGLNAGKFLQAPTTVRTVESTPTHPTEAR
jgi:membrane fusion protein, multidrug efflux system